VSFAVLATDPPPPGIMVHPVPLLSAYVRPTGRSKDEKLRGFCVIACVLGNAFRIPSPCDGTKAPVFFHLSLFLETARKSRSDFRAQSSARERARRSTILSF
jgi:hypothetical protein